MEDCMILLDPKSHYQITNGPGRLEILNSLLFLVPGRESWMVPVRFNVLTPGGRDFEELVSLTSIEVMNREAGVVLFRGFTEEGRYFIQGMFNIRSRKGYLELVGAEEHGLYMGVVRGCTGCGFTIAPMALANCPKIHCPNCGDLN